MTNKLSVCSEEQWWCIQTGQFYHWYKGVRENTMPLERAGEEAFSLGENKYFSEKVEFYESSVEKELLFLFGKKRALDSVIFRIPFINL